MDNLRLAWRTPAAGSLDRLRLQEETLPPPGPGEARVRVEAIGLNFADIFACQGLYSATPSGSFVPGLECAGVIESLGDGAQYSVHATPRRPGHRTHALRCVRDGTECRNPIPSSSPRRLDDGASRSVGRAGTHRLAWTGRLGGREARRRSAGAVRCWRRRAARARHHRRFGRAADCGGRAGRQARFPGRAAWRRTLLRDRAATEMLRRADRRSDSRPGRRWTRLRAGCGARIDVPAGIRATAARRSLRPVRRGRFHVAGVATKLSRARLALPAAPASSIRSA